MEDGKYIIFIALVKGKTQLYKCYNVQSGPLKNVDEQSQKKMDTLYLKLFIYSMVYTYY